MRSLANRFSSRAWHGSSWRSRFPWAPLAVAVLALLGARSAHAYCRTTTTPLPGPSFDPSLSSMCWMQGVPLGWPAGIAIPYSLGSAASQQVTLADATRVADAAFNTWNTAACPSGSDAGGADAAFALNVQAYDNGPVDATVVAMDCGLVQCGPTVHDKNHLIVFRDNDWAHNDINNTLALTTVTYGVDTGTIFDADIEINSSTTSTPPHLLTTTEPPPPDLPQNTYDLQAILTHEAGHFLGLAHATETTSIMYAYYTPGSLTLTADDLAGICAIYPPGVPAASPPHSSGCALESAPGPRNVSAVAMAAAALLLAFARRRREARSASR
jgi:MYXO-CTERM domain-containing protein